MTRTKEQLRKAIFGKLQGLRRKLNSHGVPCTYARSVLSHASGDIGFKITCRVADDGATLLPQVSVRTAAGTQTFDHLAFDQGLARIQELVSAHHASIALTTSSNMGGGSSGQERDSRSDLQDDSNNTDANANQTPFIH